MKKYASQVYQSERAQALTPFLFGEENNLDKIDFNDSRVEYYVRQRKRFNYKEFDAEQELFNKFWPPVFGPQVLQIVGGSGSGKSTFIRYFFQYFLPHYEILKDGAAADSPESKIHARALSQHIVLYTDLRRRDGMLRSYVFDSLGRNLMYISKQLGFEDGLTEMEGEYSETWVETSLVSLSMLKENDERKWYISCVLDNADQLGEAEQKELVQIVRRYVPEAPSTKGATDPVGSKKERRTLWRVVMPIRPETRIKLDRFWRPFSNKEGIELAPIEHDPLVETRALYFERNVEQSTRHFETDPFHTTDERADFEMQTPSEMAKTMHEEMLYANELDKATTFGAHALLDLLVNDSARRRLYFLPRIALSRTFRERRTIGLRSGWTPPVSSFYFFEGLIRGDADSFNLDDDESLILNLYNLGATRAVRPSSIFVGVYSIYLLTKGHTWPQVKESLLRIGHEDRDLDECEEWFLNKDLLKFVEEGKYLIESSVVEGHWLLLKERAYTDNMAVACAESWGLAAKARPTDPLQPGMLLPRFEGSLWFMEAVWEAEKSLSLYSNDLHSRCGTFSDLAASRKALKLPCVTQYVAAEYLQRITRVAEYERPQIVIKAEQEQWDRNVEKLEALVTASGDRRALEVR